MVEITPYPEKGNFQLWNGRSAALAEFSFHYSHSFSIGWRSCELLGQSSKNSNWQSPSHPITAALVWQGHRPAWRYWRFQILLISDPLRVKYNFGCSIKGFWASLRRIQHHHQQNRTTPKLSGYFFVPCVLGYVSITHCSPVHPADSLILHRRSAALFSTC